MPYEDVADTLEVEMKDREVKLYQLRLKLRAYLRVLYQIQDATLKGEPVKKLPGEVGQILDELRTYFQGVYGVGVGNLPDKFYKSEVGILVSYAYQWLLGDDLITLVEAAQLMGVTAEEYAKQSGNRVLMNTMFRAKAGVKPTLTLYFAPGEAHPKRVSRREVMRMLKTPSRLR